MAYTVYLKRSAEKELEELPAKLHDKIVEALLLLREGTRGHMREGIRALQGIIPSRNWNALIPFFAE